jgi:hypothetical protein
LTHLQYKYLFFCCKYKSTPHSYIFPACVSLQLTFSFCWTQRNILYIPNPYRLPPRVLIYLFK